MADQDGVATRVNRDHLLGNPVLQLAIVSVVGLFVSLWAENTGLLLASACGLIAVALAAAFTGLSYALDKRGDSHV